MGLRQSSQIKKLDKTRVADKIFIRETNRKLRLETAAIRMFWTQNDWKNVVFTDECGLEKLNSSEPEQTYREPSDNPRFNFFSYVTARGTGKMIFYNTLTSEIYCDRVIPYMIKDLRKEFGHKKFKIIHDNAKIHTSDYTKDFMKSNRYKRYFIGIPPQSPDMNIIEILWATLKKRVKSECARKGYQMTPRELQEEIEREWRQISEKEISALYSSLPSRLKAIVLAGGEMTDWQNHHLT